MCDKFKLEWYKNTVFLHFFLGISHSYYSVSYSISSLYMNQDREVYSGPKIVLQMQHNERERGRT